MRVICINNIDYPLSLEVNKEYDVLEEGNYYYIVDDNLEDWKYPKYLFEIKKNDDTIIS